MADKCADCKYAEADGDLADETDRYCHRYPSINHGYLKAEAQPETSQQFRFPIVRETWWCGEFAAE